MGLQRLPQYYIPNAKSAANKSLKSCITPSMRSTLLGKDSSINRAYIDSLQDMRLREALGATPAPMLPKPWLMDSEIISQYGNRSPPPSSQLHADRGADNELEEAIKEHATTIRG